MEIPQVFDTEKRYIFTNWTDSDFSCAWNGATTTVKAGETIELPEYKAFHFTKHLVNREMQGVVGVDSPEARKPLEDKTVVLISGDVDSLALTNLKKKIAEEMTAKGEMSSGNVSVEKPATNEFADIKEGKKKTK